jgi:hypothetical protein
MKSEETPQQTKRLWLASFFITVLALAGTASWFLWLFCRLMQSSIALAFDYPMSPLTSFFIDYRLGVLLLPLPWLLGAVYSLVRGRIISHHLVLFSSSLILSLGTLSIVMAIGFSLPWLPTKFVSTGIKPPTTAPTPR